MLNITVQQINGESISVDLPPGSTVADLEQRIAAQVGIPKCQQLISLPDQTELLDRHAKLQSGEYTLVRDSLGSRLSRDDKGQALLSALQSNSKGKIRQLIEIGADANYQRQGAGVTPLMIATVCCDSDIVQLLLDRGALVKRCPENVLVYLARHHYFESPRLVNIVKLLIQKEFTINQLNNALDIFFTYANFEEGDDEYPYQICMMLIQAGANLGSVHCEIKDFLLLYAVRENHTEIVNKLLSNGADPNCFVRDANYFVDDEEKTPLMIAANNGNKEIVQDLLAYDASPYYAINGVSKTPLMIAAGVGHTEVVDLLLDRGINPNHANYVGTTALRCAVENGHAEIVNKLLTEGVYLDCQALMIAARVGHEAVVDLLLDTNIDPNDANPYGKTALMCAAKNGHEAVVKRLLEHKANPIMTDYWGFDALNYARKPEVRKVIMDYITEHDLEREKSCLEIIRETIYKICTSFKRMLGWGNDQRQDPSADVGGQGIDHQQSWVVAGNIQDYEGGFSHISSAAGNKISSQWASSAPPSGVN